ncbi:MAG TPA: site-specific integrase [Xanthobacteraceae bacterium]|nr:site-specific integrase [Xanthobacteraceae bacterium]
MPEYRLTRYRDKFAVQWRDEAGRHRITLGTDSRAEADRLLASFVANAEVAGRAKAVPVATVWNGYVKSLGERPAAVTMGFMWRSIGPRFGDRDAETLTEEDCRDYIAARRKQGRSDSTIWSEMSRLRSALRWGENKRIINRAPKIWMPPPSPPRDKRMTRDQVSAFIGACEYPHVKLFAILAATTGARMGAILQLTWDRVDLDAGMIHYQDPEKAETKKGRASTPINALARSALTEAKRAALTPYVIEWAGSRVLSVKKALGAAGKRAGVPWVTAHVFRHSAACILAESGVPMGEIAQLLGHKDSRTTERVYARFSPDYLRKASKTLEFA